MTGDVSREIEETFFVRSDTAFDLCCQALCRAELCFSPQSFTAQF
jgi:hypothetical protein